MGSAIGIATTSTISMEKVLQWFGFTFGPPVVVYILGLVVYWILMGFVSKGE